MAKHILAIICAGLIAVSASAGARSDATVSAQIDRTHKGDRLPLVAVMPPPALDHVAARIRDLPAGCDALVSPLTRSDLARVAATCVS